jgi:hypothetical protein
VGIELVPSRKQIREVDAVVVPSDQLPPASKERPAEPPVEEGQRIVPEAAAASAEVVFEGDFAGAEVRPKSGPVPSVPEPVVHAEISESVAHAALEPHVEPEPVVDARTCRIAVWRGYRKATFYAESCEGDEAVALAESPTFKYHGNGIPDQTEPAAEAFRALIELLQREGWQSVQQGPAWFERTLRRS